MKKITVLITVLAIAAGVGIRAFCAEYVSADTEAVENVFVWESDVEPPLTGEWFGTPFWGTLALISGAIFILLIFLHGKEKRADTDNKDDGTEDGK